MDFGTLIGILLGSGLIGTAIIGVSTTLPDGPMTFVDSQSLMIVLGGTIAATAIAYPMREALALFKNIRAVFSSEKDSNKNTLEDIVELSDTARKGSAELEGALSGIKDPFLRDGVQMIVDGLDEESIQEILATRVENREARESAESSVFKTMGAFAPAFGMIGTLVGLVAMLFAMGTTGDGTDDGGDPAAKLGQAMGVALITTFYGALLANMFFNPMAAKLNSRIEKRNIKQNMIIDGIIMLRRRKHPILVREYLNSYLPPKDWKRED